MSRIWQRALLNSFLTCLYIYAIGLFIFYAGSIKLGKANVFLAPIAFLMLFVFSAGLTSFLILGKPVLMYIDGKKKEAIYLLGYTFLFMFIFTFFSIGILFFLR
jgi:hypothetical protein